MTALQTLKASTKSLGKLQSETATGFRIAEASHNAAYWSISVGMRSQVGAISAVRDSLGLGAAVVDVAYSAIASVADLVSDFKSKLILAKTEGIDRNAIQLDLDQLKQQIVTMSASATFGGQNWLNTDNPDHLADLSAYDTHLVSSYRQHNDGTISTGTIDVNLIRTSLFNVAGGGSLQVDPRSLGDIGGLRVQDMSPYGVRAYEHYEFTGPVTFDDDDAVRFTLTLDASVHSPGETFDIVIDKTVISAALGSIDGHIEDPNQMSQVMSEALQQAGAPASSGYNLNPSYYVFAIQTHEGTGHVGSSVSISLVESLDSGRGAMGLEEPPLADYDNLYAVDWFYFTGPFRVHNEAVFSFDIEINGGPVTPVSVNRDMVDAVLGTSDGIVSNADEMSAILDHALSGLGLRSTSSGGHVLISVDGAIHPEEGSKSRFLLYDVVDNLGNLPDFDLVDVDITDPLNSLDNYINGIDGMHRKVVAAASYLGAIKTRIESQDRFASQLMDAIERGIGQLIDADMGKTAARLRAEEVRQQLAMQALSISNNSPQVILQLFQQ